MHELYSQWMNLLYSAKKYTPNVAAAFRGQEVKEALRAQMEVQRRLHEQVEVTPFVFFCWLSSGQTSDILIVEPRNAAAHYFFGAAAGSATIVIMERCEGLALGC